jgi:hypothetical protein
VNVAQFYVWDSVRKADAAIASAEQLSRESEDVDDETACVLLDAAGEYIRCATTWLDMRDVWIKAQVPAEA